MTEEKKINKNAMLTLRSQYIKDLSFENPNAPASFMAAKSTPDIQVALDLGAKKLETANSYEVALHLKIEAKQAASTMFVLELVYGTNAVIEGIDEQHLQPILFVDVPYLMFPFVRQIVADVTKNGGFVPLMLDPINFAELFNQRNQKVEDNQKN